jgi:uncharacterized protein (TIGR03067 family)
MTRLLAVLSVGLLGLSVAAQDKKGAGDAASIQGTWKVEEYTKNGTAVPAEEAKQLRLTVADGKMTVRMGEQEVARATYKIDPSKTPKQIDFSPEGAEGMTQEGIYELTGDGLKLCMGRPGKGRPKEFKSEAGGEQSLVVLKREKK